MPNNYAPTVNPGDTRRRIWRLTGENPNGALPSMVFHEQEVIRTTEGTEAIIQQRTRDMERTYDPTRVVQMRRPDTDALGPVGRLPADLTEEEIYAVFYSISRDSQLVQDAIDDASPAPSEA